MKKLTKIAILSTALLSSTTAFAFNQASYSKTCLGSLERSIELRGTADINGTYLEYKGDEAINPRFKSLYFSPDYSLYVVLGDNSRNKMMTYDLNETAKSVRFYSHRAKKSGDRKGLRYDLIKDGEDYVLKAKSSNRHKYDEDGKIVPLFKNPFSFGAPDTDPILEIRYERNKEKELDLYKTYTEKTENCK